MSEFDFVENDTASALVVTCYDQAGAVIDLTNSTAKLRWKQADGAVVERVMSKDNATGGVVSYRFADGELKAPKMSFEVKITDNAGKVVSSTTLLPVTVRKAL